MSIDHSAPHASYAAMETNAAGTRFTFKPSGSQFSGTGGTYMRSCLGCSLHRPATSGQFRKIAGRTQFICSDACAGKLGLKPKATAAAH